MKAILDRLEWIALYMRQTPEERAADERDVAAGKKQPYSTLREIAWQSWEEIKAIAEILPDCASLSIPEPLRHEDRSQPERIIDLPVE
jgi:hypothetical protein